VINIKKLFLSILVACLLLSGNAYAEPNKNAQKELIANNIIYIDMNMKEFSKIMKTKLGASLFWNSVEKKHAFYGANQAFGDDIDTMWYSFELINKNEKKRYGFKWGIKLKKFKLTKIWDDPIKGYDYHIKLSDNSTDKQSLITEKSIIQNNKNYLASKKIEDEKITQDLTFTIKDKKEQCTAIGFAPATEKFADCVLRLVELDVKSQQAAQIALAQSQGNLQVAEQLKKQNNSRSSDAFIDFGLKLLSPQSTVSAPSTSTCRVIGSGAYKTVNCW
jgi:hypothetical protein